MTGVPRNRRLAWAAVLVAAAALCPAAPTRAADPPEKLVAELEQVRQESIAAAREAQQRQSTIGTLTRAHERLFLANVGPIALKAARESERDKQSERNKSTKRSLHNGRRRRASSAEHLLAAG